MAKSLSVLIAASEIYPYSKETGTADFGYSLALALRDIGNDVRVMMPKYGSISERKNKIHEINRLKDMPINMITEIIPATVKSSSVTNGRNKVQAYITTNYQYFDQMKGVYHDPVTWELYPNNDERFLFFCKSVIQTCVLLEWYPDIIHVNDWHTAIIPALAKIMYPKKFAKTQFVYTIHNFYNQGEFPIPFFKKTELPESELVNFKHKGKINLMKAGIHYADYVTTVSKQYSKEILEEKEKSNGLNTALKAKQGLFLGILNGFDKWTWNPKRDSQIHSKLDGNFEDFKYNNKVALINKFGFEYSPKTPIIAMVTRVVPEKGINLLIEAADELFKLDVQFVLIGQGDADLKQELEKISQKYPDKFKCEFKIDDELTRLAEAGADMYLMCSEHEPVGMGFMYSSVYGAVPVVRKVGGLNETAIPFDGQNEEGNSFCFENYSSKDMMVAIKNALDYYKDKSKWLELSERITEQDFSWDKGAKQYDEIYRRLIKEMKEVQTKPE